MEELWAGIKEFGYDAETGVSTFEVSNLGQFRRAGYVDALGYHPPVPVKVCVNKRDNIKRVHLRFGHRHMNLSIHKLVATYFVQNPEKAKYVKWIDGDTINCVASNLIWTSVRNMSPGVGGGFCKPVRIYTSDIKLLGEFDSGKDAAETLGVDKSSISDCCRRNIASYLGLIWRFVSDDEFYKSGMESECDFEKLKALCSTTQYGTPRCAIRQYSYDGVLIAEYPSSEQIGEKFQSGRKSVLSCCKRLYSNSYGYVWRYVYDDELFNLSEVERSKIIKGRLEQVNMNFVRQYNFDGKLVATHTTLKAAETATGVGRKHISMVCRRYKDVKTAGECVWRYEKDDELFALSESERKVIIDDLRMKKCRRVRQYSLLGELIGDYRSVLEAVRATGFERTDIINSCNGWKGSYASNGYVWNWAS